MLNEGRNEIIHYSVFLFLVYRNKGLPFSGHLFCAISHTRELTNMILLILNTILCDIRNVDTDPLV